jgi:hypothetical protein
MSDKTTNTPDGLKTWYRVCSWAPVKIRPVKVVRFTEHYVTVWCTDRLKPQSQKCARVSEVEAYFPTQVEAVAYWRRKLTQRVSSAARQLESAERELREFDEKWGEK